MIARANIIDYGIVLGPSYCHEAKEIMLGNQEKGIKRKPLEEILSCLVIKLQGLRFLTVRGSWRCCMPSIMPSVLGEVRGAPSLTNQSDRVQGSRDEKSKVGLVAEADQ